MIHADTFTETLLASGGDERTALDPRTGRNRYGYRTRPEPEIASWSSSTGATPSVRAFRAASVLRERLFADPRGLEARALSAGREAADALRALLGLDASAGVEVVLTPSATDAELIPLLFLLGEGHAPVVNILVGEGELGSATSIAAAGRHCAAETPLGGPVEKSAPIKGFPSDWVTVRTVRVRDHDGEILPGDVVDRAAAAHVTAALANGHRVILHLVASSKTGIRAPSLAMVEEAVRAAPDRVRVVVDAAQGRATDGEIRAYLERGFLVLFSGSKFSGGPCYCGAALVPTRRWQPPRGALPVGLRRYLSRADLPEHWAIRETIPLPANLGLLLRWAGALAEMRAYRAVPPDTRRAILTGLGSAVRGATARSPWITLTDLPTLPIQSDLDDDGLSTLPTIFTLRVRGHGDLAAARRLHQRMADREGFALGQAVELGRPGTAALRIAISAPRITEIAAHVMDAAALPRRLRAEAEELDALVGSLGRLAARGVEVA